MSKHHTQHPQHHEASPSESIDREDIVSDIISALEDHSKWNEEYYRENEDNPIAEFTQSFNYGEASFDDMDLTNFTEDTTFDVIIALRKSIGDDATLELMGDHSTLNYSSMYINHSEYHSNPIGEVEYQIDSIDDVAGLAELLKTIELTSDEIEKIERYVALRDFKDLLSGNSCFGYSDFGGDRWVLILDEDEFLKAAAEKIEMDAETKEPKVYPALCLVHSISEVWA